MKQLKAKVNHFPIFPKADPEVLKLKWPEFPATEPKNRPGIWATLIIHLDLSRTLTVHLEGQVDEVSQVFFATQLTQGPMLLLLLLSRFSRVRLSATP